MSLNRRDGGTAGRGGALGFGDEATRRDRWSSFLTHLEETCQEGEDEEENSNDDPRGGPGAASAAGDNGGLSALGGDGTDDRMSNSVSARWSGRGSGSAVKSLYLQRLRGGDNIFPPGLAASAVRREKMPAAAVPLPMTVTLREWIDHYKRNGPANNGNSHFPGVGVAIDGSYLEGATRVALSLARKIGENCSSEAITVDNAIVSDTARGEVELIHANLPPGDGGDSQSTSARSQRKVIYSLGKVFYEIFTQGRRPKSSTERRSAPASFSEPSSFGAALDIGNEDGGRDDARSRRKLPRRTSEERGGDHYAALRLSGVPPSLCRLVSHMLDNDDEGDMGGLFRPDRSVASLSDVVDDLQQMVDDPVSFLHDAFVMRLEPKIRGTKLYGRTDELRRCREVADEVSRDGVDRPRQQVLMISGFAGSGKSRLAREAGALLEAKDWRVLLCKFDQEVRSRPLATVISAFDNFLAEATRDVGSRVKDSLDEEDLEALCRLIPALDNLRPAQRQCGEGNNEEISFDTSGAEASRCRLHRLFGLLVRSLSERERPLLICVDDLQWADTASLELINSLVEGRAEEDNGGSRMLFVGCYRRSNDAAGSRSLNECIREMKDCRSIALEEIHLEGLSSNDVNDLVSDALCYPRRLTRSLSNLIYEKSTGNPLFVKELLDGLSAENLLQYSLSRHRWNWDEEMIEMKAVSNGVADLLTERLRRLPQNVLAALQVMSCFGHHVSSQILAQVKVVCGSSDIVAALDSAAEELLIKKIDLRDQSGYCFVHDMVQNAVSFGIGQDRRVRVLKEIADTLIARTHEGRTDADLFIIVDLVNRVKPCNTPISEDRVRYAEFNLLAANKSIQMPDYPSALEYVESGISFLDAGHWENEYDLSLALFKSAAGSAWALGKLDLMTSRLGAVFDNARCYEDKLHSKSVLVQSLTMLGEADSALDCALEVLEYLGEPLSKNLDDNAIRREMVETHEYAQRLLPASRDSLPVMKDPTKVKAMHFLYFSLLPSQHLMSKSFVVVVSCRMVRLTVTHGLNVCSAAGIAALACMYCAFLRNYTEGYKLGKLALAFNESPRFLVGELSLAVTNYVCVFKEPIQALLPIILENYKIALKFGEMNSACSNSLCYAIRAFLSGSSLGSLNKEMLLFAHQMSRHNRIRSYMCLIPIFNAIANLSGETKPPFCHAVQGYEDNDKNLSKAFEKKDMGLCETLITLMMIELLISRRMDLAERVVRQYQEFFDVNGGVLLQVVAVYRTFYFGLVAFYCFRETQDRYWLNWGKKATRGMETLANECAWNFENKFILLNAEYHFSMGDFDKATEAYLQSIASAHSHRVVHEEAMANELAAHCQLKRGMKDFSIQFMKEAIECYQKWGAARKAEALKTTWTKS